jgi:hypothetical protein
MLPDILSAFLGDGLSLIGYPAAGTAATGAKLALERVMKRREDAAREVLRDELRRGNITAIDTASQDEAAAILFRYLRAAQEGTARRNLRLLAQAIRGQAERHALYADEFLRHADCLSSLTREEIKFLGIIIATEREFDRVGIPENDRVAKRWKVIEEDARMAGLISDRKDILALATGLGRNGLIILPQVLSGAVPSPSPLLMKVATLCDFEAASNEG